MSSRVHPSTRAVLACALLAAVIASASRDPASRTTTDVYTLKLLSPVTHPSARCLDGSMGGYYVGPPGDDNWLIHLQGGGWCTSIEDCSSRAAMHYGSSSSWTSGPCPDSRNMACWADNPTGVPQGLGSTNATESSFAHATHIWIAYCDGGSFAGHLDSPVAINASFSLHFRGRAILDAVLDELISVEGLARAQSVLLKGCSAGGQAVYLAADHVGARVAAVAPSARFAAAPGAGMFLNVSAFGGLYSFASVYRWVHDAQNASGSTSAACRAALGAEEAWQCFLPTVAFGYVASSLFIANSLVDSCAAEFIMLLPCDPRKPPGAAFACGPLELAYLSSYRATMLDVVRPVLARRPDHGAFLQACWVHIVEDDTSSWLDTRVAGQSQRATFDAWWATGGGETGGGVATVAIDGEWRSNPTCTNWGTCY